MINYVELFLNEPATTKLDLNQEFSIALQYSIADIRDITKRNAAFSKTILLPGTKNNNYWMGNLYDVNSDFTMFNPNRKTPCTISVNSEVVMKGFLQLRKIKKLMTTDEQGNQIYYEVVVFNNAVDLMSELGEKTLNQLDLSELIHSYTFNNIVYSWTQSWTNGWVYPMYGLPTNTNQYGVTDFYPSYYSKYLLGKIFQEAGFGWTGSLAANEQFSREIIPFVGSGSQSLTQEVIDQKNFRVGVTQSFTYSQVLNTFPQAQSAVFLTNQQPPTVNAGFVVSFTYSLPVDSYQDPFFPQNSLYDNGNNWNTITSVWTTDTNRKWKPIWSVNYDMQWKNTNSDNIVILSNNASVKVQSMELDLYHYIEYQLPFTTTWVNWHTVLKRVSGWVQTNPSYWASGLALTENINFYDESCPELFLPALSKVRLRVVVNPCNGGGTSPFNANKVSYSAFKYIGSQYITGTLPGNSANNRKLGMTITFKGNGNYFFSNGLVFAAQEGDPIVADTWISSKIKQKDFITDLIKRYNLYIQVDPNNERLLILDTRTDFYNKVLNLDWTNKKDYSSEDEITLLAELQFKEMLFTMKSDTSDQFNKDYQSLVGDVYGQYKYSFGNEFVKGQQKIESPFSPTPLVKTQFGAVTPALSPQDPKVNPRVLYWGGLITPPFNGFTWQLSSVYQTAYFTQYPYAGHFDNPYAPTFDIHFGTPKYMYYYEYGVLPTDTMYEAYWSSYVDQIEDGKLVKSSFYLDEFDIRTIKDNFWAKIFILDSYYYVNKIIDYKPMEGGLTTVELIKIKEGFKYIKKPGRTASVVRPSKLIKEAVAIGDFGINNGTIGVNGGIVIGNNNSGGGKVIVGSQSWVNKQFILGDNNIVEGDKSGIIGGDNNKVKGSSNWAIQSSGLDIEGSNIIAISNNNATYSDSNSAYIGTGIKGDLDGKSGRYAGINKGINLSVEGYDLGQSDWRYIPEGKEVVIQSGKESRPKDMTILGHLEIETITGTFSFGDKIIYQQAFVEVEEQLNIDGVLTVGGELCVGKCGESGGSGVVGSSGTSGTSGGGSGSGTSGTSGTSGNNGSSGTSGTSGAAGVSGSSGTSGNSGTSGTSPNQNLNQTLILGNTSSTQIQLANGSVSQPSYSFSDSTSTGMYQASNQLRFSAFGFDSMRIATSSVRIADGSLGQPSLSFISNTDLGFYRIAANRIGFVSGGLLYANLLSNETDMFQVRGQATASNNRFYHYALATSGGEGRWKLGIESDATTFVLDRWSGASFVNNFLRVSTTTASISYPTSFTSTILASDGTTGTPSIAFTNDTDTGLFRNTTNELAITAGGVRKAVFTPTAIYLEDETYYPDGTRSIPAMSFNLDTDTGIFRPGANQLAITSGGATAAIFGATQTTVSSLAATSSTMRFVMADGEGDLMATNNYVFYASTGQGATVSNTTSELITYQQLIPANTFKTGDVIELYALAGWANTTYTRVLRINGSTASGTLGGALPTPNTRLAQGASSAARVLGIQRHFWIYDATGGGEGTMNYPTAPNAPDDTTTGGGGQPTIFPIDWTKDYYITFALQHTNILDTGRGASFYIRKIN